MPEFSKEIANFLKGLGTGTAKASRASKSSAALTPGDILYFKYSHTSRLVLVVSNKVGNGVFISTKGNMCLSCFQLDASPEVLGSILPALYKNRRRCSYDSIKKSLIKILGKRNFRTFFLRDIKNLNSLEIDIDSLQT